MRAGEYRYQWGRLFALYLIWYGVGRTVWESIRIDPSEIFLGVRTNVWAALAAILVGLIIFFGQRRRHPGAERSVYVPGREWSPEAVVHSDDTYTDSDDDDDDAATNRPVADSVASGAESTATSGSGAKS
jgi:hypothetical protein